VLLSDFTHKALKRVLATVDVLKETGLFRLDIFEAELLIVFAQLSITNSAKIQDSVFKLCAKALLLHSMNSRLSPHRPSRQNEWPKCLCGEGQPGPRRWDLACGRGLRSRTPSRSRTCQTWSARWGAVRVSFRTAST
jgi:hypothetical protein